MMPTLQHYLIASGLLFAVGLLGLCTRRNVLLMLLSIEIIFNAANLAFVAFAHHRGEVLGQVVVVFTMTVAAAEVTVGLAIAILLHRALKTLNADEVQLLKW